MRTPRQDATLTSCGVERENLRAVYEQAREQGDLQLALRIVTFAPIMRMRERRLVIDELLASTDDVDECLLGHALTAQAQFAWGDGLAAEGFESARRAGEIFDRLGNRHLAAWARYFEMFTAWGYLDDEVVRAWLGSII